MKRIDMFHVKRSEIILIEGFNAREDMGDIKGLAESIVANGITNPLSGEKIRGEDTFKLVNGHRRLEAVDYALEQGWIDEEFLIPIKKEKSMSDEDRTLRLIIQNDGKKLSILEQSIVYGRLAAFGNNASEIARKVGKSATHVTDCLNLDAAPESLKEMIRTGEIAGSLAVEQLRNGTAEELEITVKKVKKDTGVKKVSKKHLGGQQSKGLKVADMEAMFSALNDEEDAGNVVLDVDKMDTFHNIVKFYNGSMDKDEFALHFVVADEEEEEEQSEEGITDA